VVVDVEAIGANAAAVAVAGIRLTRHHRPLADRKTGEGVEHEAKKRKGIMAPAHTRRDLYGAFLLLATNKTFTNSGKKYVPSFAGHLNSPPFILFFDGAHLCSHRLFLDLFFARIFSL